MNLTYKLNHHIQNFKCEMCYNEIQHNIHVLCLKGNDFNVIGDGCKKIYNNLQFKILFHDIHNYPLQQKNINQSVHQYIQNKILFSHISDIFPIKDDILILKNKKCNTEYWEELINDRIQQFKIKSNCQNLDLNSLKMLTGYNIQTIHNIINTNSFLDIKERIIIYLSNK